MLHPIISGYKRLLFVAYVDDKDEFHKNLLCVVENDEMEDMFEKDFESEGILYHKIITENKIMVDKVKHLRIVSEPIRHIESFTSFI